MVTALWIIAICEIIRLIQNTIQLTNIINSKALQRNAHEEFIKSLKKNDREFVRDLLKEFEEYEDKYNERG